MRAIQVLNDEHHTLRLTECPDPEIGPEEVLIRVHAAAVNRADLLQRRGHYPPPPGESQILGLEAAGEIVAMGRKVANRRNGDRVFCLLGGGGYAELVKSHADMLLSIPRHWSYAQAAAVPEAFYTAFVNLFMEAKLRKGEILLVHAGGSGVGTAAIQMARHSGALVVATASSDDKIERCKVLGANHGINYNTDDFAEVVQKITNQAGVDVVLDCIGAYYFPRNIAVLRPQGRLVLIGTMGGTKAEIDLAQVLRRRLRIIGSLLRSRPLEEKIHITRLFRHKVMPQLERGNFQPVIDRVVPLAEAGQAHEYIVDNLNFGKIVLQVI